MSTAVFRQRRGVYLHDDHRVKELIDEHKSSQTLRHRIMLTSTTITSLIIYELEAWARLASVAASFAASASLLVNSRSY